jgi:hypothetical protein
MLRYAFLPGIALGAKAALLAFVVTILFSSLREYGIEGTQFILSEFFDGIVYGAARIAFFGFLFVYTLITIVYLCDYLIDS